MAFIRHLTLTAATVSTVTVTPTDNASQFEVLNRDGAAEIYISHDGTATPANPTVAGNDFDVVPAAVGAALRLPRVGSGSIVVKVISAGTPAISVKAIP